MRNESCRIQLGDKKWLFALVTLLAACPAYAVGPSTSAIQKVEKGVKYFQTARFVEAKKAFADAEAAEPDNPLIQFDHACALAESNEVEKARELYLQSALAKDPKVAASSHYNLGGLAATLGRVALGEDPVAVNKEQRKVAIDHLMTAVGHYRDCLRVDSDHADARYNLELLRLYGKQIQAQWDERDREEQRKEKNLLEFLAMIEQKESVLRSQAEGISADPGSPGNRLAIRLLSENQRSLREEIAPLKVKIHKQLNSSSPPANPLDVNVDGGTEKMKEIAGVLMDISDEAAEKMDRAADAIDAMDWKIALKYQRDVLDRFNEIYATFAPFVAILQRAVGEQKRLVSDHDTQSGAHSLTVDNPSSEDSKNPETSKATMVDRFDQLAWQQDRITDWVRTLESKARLERDTLAKAESSAQDNAKLNTTIPSNGNDLEGPQGLEEKDSVSIAADDAHEASVHADAMTKALDKAIELGPEIVARSSKAMSELKNERLADALPEQKETFRMLQEIADLLPKDDSQPDEGDKQNKDQQNKDQPGQEGEKGSRDEQEESTAQPDPKKDSNDSQDEGSSKLSSNTDNESPSRQQALSILQKVREREQQHRQLQKQMEVMRGIRVPVERDW